MCGRSAQLPYGAHPAACAAAARRLRHGEVGAALVRWVAARWKQFKPHEQLWSMGATGLAWLLDCCVAGPGEGTQHAPPTRTLRRRSLPMVSKRSSA